MCIRDSFMILRSLCLCIIIIYLFLACVCDLYYKDKMDLAEENESDIAVSNKAIITTLVDKPFSPFEWHWEKWNTEKWLTYPKSIFLKRYKNQSKISQSPWYDQYKWLCGSAVNSKLFCWLWLMLSTNKTIWSYK